MSKLSPDTVKRPPNSSVPVRGYISRETSEEIWLQDQKGTWVIRKEDVAAMTEWKGGDPRFEGKPAMIFIRDGAEILDVRPVTVSFRERPITLLDPSTMPPVEGLELLKALQRKWARHLGFTSDESQLQDESHTTYCDINGGAGGNEVWVADDSG